MKGLKGNFYSRVDGSTTVCAVTAAATTSAKVACDCLTQH